MSLVSARQAGLWGKAAPPEAPRPSSPPYGSSAKGWYSPRRYRRLPQLLRRRGLVFRRGSPAETPREVLLPERTECDHVTNVGFQCHLTCTCAAGCLGPQVGCRCPPPEDPRHSEHDTGPGPGGSGALFSSLILRSSPCELQHVPQLPEPFSQGSCTHTHLADDKCPSVILFALSEGETVTAAVQ